MSPKHCDDIDMVIIVWLLLNANKIFCRVWSGLPMQFPASWSCLWYMLYFADELKITYSQSPCTNRCTVIPRGMHCIGVIKYWLTFQFSLYYTIPQTSACLWSWSCKQVVPSHSELGGCVRNGIGCKTWELWLASVVSSRLEYLTGMAPQAPVPTTVKVQNDLSLSPF